MPRSRSSDATAFAGLVSEYHQRSLFGRNQGEVGRAVIRVGARCGHQRKLVQREWPGGSGRNGEHNVLDMAGIDVREQIFECQAVRRAAKCERSRHRLVGLRACRNKQRVIGDLAVRARAQHAAARIHLRGRIDVQLRIVIARDRSQVEARCLSETERLHDRKGRISKVALRSHHHQLYPRTGQPAQSDHCLQRGKAATGDHDTVRSRGCHVTLLRMRSGPGPRRLPPASCRRSDAPAHGRRRPAGARRRPPARSR